MEQKNKTADCSFTILRWPIHSN